MTEDNNEGGLRGTSIDRRTVLKGAAIGGGLAGIPGLATARRGGGGPCHKDFSCEDGTYVKFEFVIETDDDGNIIDCYFEEETDTGLLEITDWETKPGTDCEPITVSWADASEGDSTYVATRVMAYGGRDCETVTDPGTSYSADKDGDAGLDTPGGNTAAISNLQFCVIEELTLPVEDVYVGYEDRPASGDFDYNDFGMDANITETYASGELTNIEMSFTSRVYKAGDDHVIHIERELPTGVEWEYTVDRSGGTDVVTSNVAQADGSGSGTLDIALFDTGPLSNGDTTDATVEITVDITAGSESPPTASPRPDVAANNPLFEVYDPWMRNTSQNIDITLDTVQNDVNKGATGWNTASDVPNIVVVPVTNFTPPDEQVTITQEYPDFDDYYMGGDTDNEIEVDSTYDDWYM